MKKLIYLLLVCGCTPVMAQKPTVRHKLYTSYFNPAAHEPDSVSWNLNAAMLNCKNHLPRSNKFIADPMVPGTALNRDYAKSGYDQGHQMPAQDNSCDPIGEVECFYFSNMVPQTPELNRVVWKNLEVWCRKEAAVHPLHIICGVLGSLGTIGPDKVNIPAYCYKAIYDNGKWVCYIMPNTHTVKAHPYSFYAVTVVV